MRGDVTQVAASGAGLESIAPYRGWVDDDWAAATERPRLRGWLDADRRLTAAGASARADVEAVTDRIAGEPLLRLGATNATRLLGLLEPIARELFEHDAIRYPNPIGVPPPDTP